MNIGIEILEHIANLSSASLMAYLLLDGRECHGLSAQKISDSRACRV